MNNPHTATSPALATAMSIITYDLKLPSVIEVVDRGAVGNILELEVLTDSPVTDKQIKTFKTIMKENCFTIKSIAKSYRSEILIIKIEV